MKREEIEKYGKILDNEENLEFFGLEKQGSAYKICDNESFLIYTGRLGAIRYIKEFIEELEKCGNKAI